MAGVLVLWVVAGMGSAGAAVSTCGTGGTFSSSGSTATCTYTTAGSDTFTVPSGVSSLDVVAIGAAGGTGPGGSGSGGEGASVEDTSVPVGELGGDALPVAVGGVGSNGTTTGGAGGTNGGGAGGDYPNGVGQLDGGGGGGYSGLFQPETFGGEPPLVIAGGGGGGGGGNYPPFGINTEGGAGDVGSGGGTGGGGGDSTGGGGGSTSGGGSAGTGAEAGNGAPGTSLQGGQGGSSGGGSAGGGGGGGYNGGGGGGGGDDGSSFGAGGGGGASFGVTPGLSNQANTTAPASVKISWSVASTGTSVATPASGATNTAIPAGSISSAVSGGSSPTGTITFKVFGPQSSAPSDCTTGGQTVGTASVSGDGTYNPSAGFTPTTAGTYWWYASYGGDTNNGASNSRCGSGMASTTVAPPAALTGLSPNAGPTAGGNTVTIKGANFTSTATVKFGSTVSTSVTFDSSTQLSAVAPPHASGVVNVTVATGGAKSATSKQSLYAYGPPTVSSFTPTAGITGRTVTIMGNNFVPGAKVKFGSKGSPKVSFVSSTELKAVVPNGAVTGEISVTTAAGTATSSTSFTVTLSITGLSPTSGPVGTSVTIKGVGFNSKSVVRFNGTTATVTSRSSTQLNATVPTGATSGPITVTNTGTVSSAASFTVT